MNTLPAGARALDCVTFGETMTLLYGAPAMPLPSVAAFTRSIAGAESNVAVGLARLGHRVGWFGRVGADAFGAGVLAALRADSVDVSRARIDEDAPTGVLVRDCQPHRRTSVLYYRSGSAGSRLTPDDVDAGYLAEARLLHVTGITPALSATALAAAERAVELAKAHGTLVSFDPNLRLRLWSAVAAAPVVRRLGAQADIVLVGHHEAALLCGRDDPEAAAEWFGAGRDGRVVVVKQGAAGACATDGRETWRSPAYPVPVVDPVGAGDAFDAGYLSAVLRGQDPGNALSFGCAVAALAVTAPGDIEGLPYRDDVDAMLLGADIDR